MELYKGEGMERGRGEGKEREVWEEMGQAEVKLIS
jgi:hypothetical protein